MAFRVLLSRKAVKDLNELEPATAQRIDQAFSVLKDNPYPAGAKQLHDSRLAQFRIRVGDYRILYDIYSKDGAIYILRVGHRRNIYK